MLYTRPPAVDVARGDPFEAPVRAIVVPVAQEEGRPAVKGPAERADKLVGGVLSAAVKAGSFKAKRGERLEAYYEGRIVLFVGLGEGGLEDRRSAYAAAVSHLAQKVDEALVVVEPSSGPEALESVVGALLGAYSLEEFKKERKRKLERLQFTVEKGVLDEALAIAEGVYLARDLANAPPHEVAPPKLARLVRDLFKRVEGVEVEVLEYERLVEEGFGGIVAVGKGSAQKPVLIILRYMRGEGDPIALVGKTIVFDSGGVNLKPSHALFEMRADKAGGAAVLGALWTIARLGLKVNVVALLPAAINVISGEAYLPSDVIKMWDGTYVEVTNTDAEGRLTLADAIAYAAEKLGAREVVTIATLTGAAAVALGPLYAAYFTKDEGQAKRIEEASRASGENVWRLPLVEAYRQAIKRSARVGDIVNAAMRMGGAICAALFLDHFSHGKPLLHIDIAGPGIGLGAEAVEPPAYWPKRMAPGWGARLLYEYVKRA